MVLDASTTTHYALLSFKFGIAGTGISSLLLLSYYFQCLSHTILVSTSLQSMYFQRQMNENLLQMAESFVKATSFQLSSNEDHVTASEYRGKALQDAEVGEESLHESMVLKEKSKKDEAQGMIYQENGEFFGERASAEAEESALHSGVAAEDEVSYDTLMAESVVQSELAFRNEELALEDMEAVSACNFVPFLDYLCDVIGGIAEVGLQVKAAKEAVLASEDYIAATSVKVEEEAEELLAAEFELKSGIDASKAGDFEVMAEKEFEEAKIELAAAAKLQEDGEMELAKSAEENEMSVAEEVKAEEEEVLSRKALKDAMIHGSRGLFNGVIMILSSFFALSFCTLKLLINVAIPATSLLFNNILLPIATRRSVNYSIIPTQTMAYYLLEYLSFCILHCSVFLSTILIYSKKITNFYALSLRGKGGFIILFALNGSIMKSLIMQIIHRAKLVRKSHQINQVNRENEKRSILSSCKVLGKLFYFFLKDFFFFHALFTMEILFIWIVFAPNLQHNNFLLNMQGISCYSWVTPILCYLAVHIWFFETLAFNKETNESSLTELQELGNDTQSKSSKIIEVISDCKDESKPLLQKNVQYYRTEVETSSFSNVEKIKDIGSTFDNKFDFALQHLRIPLEILISSCMVILLRSTIPQFIKLRPVYLRFWQRLQEHYGDTFMLYCFHALVFIIGIVFLIALMYRCMKV